MTGPLEEVYVLDAAQDLNEQVWESDSNIAGMQKTDDPNDEWHETTPVVRTAFGVLEFLNDVTETLHNFLETDSPIPAKRPKLEAIRTRELGSDKWRAGKRTVAVNQSKIVTESSNRRKITLINYGPSVVHISAMPNPQPGSPNTIQLPVNSATFYAPVTLCTRDDVYAICATATGVVDIIEEFDLES